MYQYWSMRVDAGDEPTPREVSEACKTTIHAARTAVRRYSSGIVPKPVSPGLAPKTVQNVHGFLHRALVDAVAWKYLSDNPASNVKPPRRPRTRRQVWKTEEIQIFLKSVRDDRFAALFLLELTTGIRRGQVCGLKWDAVDSDAGEITLHNNRVVVGGRARDKAGGKTRNADKTISIDRATVAALRRWRDVQDSERAFFDSTTTRATTCSPTRTAGHFTPTRSVNVSTAWPPRPACRASPFTISATRTPPAHCAPA
jgi:integrase